MRVAQIKPAIDRWWLWFGKFWWKRGNGWKEPLVKPGYCGVTNQDLVTVAALAKYAAVYGDASLFENYGLPVLDAYLQEDYYYRALGLFERGDNENFTERTSYYEIILDMLDVIYRDTRDERLVEVADNIVRHLFDALDYGSDGMLHLAWGASLDSKDKSKVVAWQRFPHALSSYPELLRHMQRYLGKHPDAELNEKCGALEQTLAAYTFANGAIPISMGSDPLFTVVGHSNALWRFLIDRLAGQASLNADVLTAPVMPTIRRVCGEVEWRENVRMWSIHRGGRREFAGLKCNPSAIAIGAEEVLPNVDLSPLNEVEFEERVSPLMEGKI